MTGDLPVHRGPAPAYRPPYLFIDTDGVMQARELAWPDARAVAIPVRRNTVTLDFAAHVSDRMLAELDALEVEAHTVSFWCEDDAIDDFVRAVGGPLTHLRTAPFPGWAPCGRGDRRATPGGHLSPCGAEGCGYAHAPQPRNPAIANDFIADPAWKPHYIEQVLASDPRPFIWADDREVPEHGAALSARFSHIPHLLVAPVTRVGLTPEDVHRMREFAHTQ